MEDAVPDARSVGSAIIGAMTWKWKLLRAGAFRLDGGSMFGVVPKAIWARLTEPDGKNRILLQTNCLLLERSFQPPTGENGEQQVPGEGSSRAPSSSSPSSHPSMPSPVTPLPRSERNSRVLIETGYGGKWTDKDRSIFALENRTIVDAMAEVGVSPDSIDVVIVTHLHFDHAGGLTRWDEQQQPVPTFPNATVIVQQREWLDALANKSTMTKTYLRTHLDPIRDQVRTVEGAVEVLPGMHVALDPGHTWGQQMVRFVDEKGVVCFPGDVMPTVNHVGLAFSMGYDMEPYTNMQSKISLLERARAENWRLVLDHEPGIPVVCVAREDGKFVLRTVDEGS